MSETQIFESVDREECSGKYFSVYKNIDLKDVMQLVDRVDIVSATDGRFTIVQDGAERDSLDTSWHQDGLSYQYPPRTFLLYCESAGQHEISTDLADVSATLNVLSTHDQSMLERMFRCYVSRSGEQQYKDRVMQRDIDTGERFLNLCSRGWVQGDIDMTLEQMTRTMSSLFESIYPCYVHSWRDGDCLIFNNYKYLHRRHNPKNIPDPSRKLIRMWFTSDFF